MRLVRAIPDAQELLGLSPRQFEKLIATGKIPVVRMGRRRMVREDVLRTILENGIEG